MTTTLEMTEDNEIEVIDRDTEQAVRKVYDSSEEKKVEIRRECHQTFSKLNDELNKVTLMFNNPCIHHNLNITIPMK